MDRRLKFLHFDVFAYDIEEYKCSDLQFMNNGNVLMLMPFRLLVKFFSPIELMKICVKEVKYREGVFLFAKRFRHFT